jgi:hypothetical protein
MKVKQDLGHVIAQAVVIFDNLVFLPHPPQEPARTEQRSLDFLSGEGERPRGSSIGTLDELDDPSEREPEKELSKEGVALN